MFSVQRSATQEDLSLLCEVLHPRVKLCHPPFPGSNTPTHTHTTHKLHLYSLYPHSERQLKLRLPNGLLLIFRDVCVCRDIPSGAKIGGGWKGGQGGRARRLLCFFYIPSVWMEAWESDVPTVRTQHKPPPVFLSG